MMSSLRKLNKPLAASFSPLRLKVHALGAAEFRWTSRPRASSTAAIDDELFFPWRHSSMLPDRILERNDYSGAFNPTARDPPILRKLIAARELNIPVCNVLPIPFYKHEWEVDLANGFAVAFEFAMIELLRSIFRVRVEHQDGIISLDSSKGDSMNDICDSVYDNEYLKGMMDKKLIKQYQINPEKMQLKFTLQPIEATLQHIFAVPVPGLTREIVEDNPYLRGAIYRLHSAYDENGFDEHYFDLLTDFAKHGPDKRTVIAEASVRCMEFFQVKDASTGSVVQGMEDGSEAEEAVHIVRFEVVTDEGGNNEERDIGNWKIIDVDDLLEGNVFH
ncbi:hypothetical protein ACHAWF_006360 [Thalassiosira exigua]